MSNDKTKWLTVSTGLSTGAIKKLARPPFDLQKQPWVEQPSLWYIQEGIEFGGEKYGFSERVSRKGHQARDGISGAGKFMSIAFDAVDFNFLRASCGFFPFIKVFINCHQRFGLVQSWKLQETNGFEENIVNNEKFVNMINKICWSIQCKYIFVNTTGRRGILKVWCFGSLPDL